MNNAGALRVTCLHPGDTNSECQSLDFSTIVSTASMAREDRKRSPIPGRAAHHPRTDRPKITTRVFISYARKDGRELALRLYANLARVRGFRPWLDTSKIVGGEDWARAIEHEIDGCDALLAVLTHGSIASPICRGEHLRALRKDKRLIPVLGQPNADRPLYLESLNCIDFTIDYSSALERLVSEIGSGERRQPTGFQRRTRLQTVPALPAHFIPRPDELAELRRAVLSEESAASTALTALRGMGGIGKTELAAALCQDELVQTAFPDGIIWIKIGRKPGDVTAKIAVVGQALDDSERYEPETTRVPDCGSSSRIGPSCWSWTMSGRRNTLSVPCQAPRVRLLFATRDATVARALGSGEVRLGTLTPEQSLALLREHAGRDDPDLLKVAERLSGHPLALKLAGARIRDDMSGREWLDTYHRVSDIKLDFDSTDPQYSLAACFDASLAGLKKVHRQLYFAVGIFPDDPPVPPSIVVKLWRGMSSLTAAECSDLLAGLQRRELLQRDQETG